MQKIDSLLDWWSRVLVTFAVCAGVLMMLHVSLDVFFRTVVNDPLPGTNETVAAYYMILATFMPLAYLGLTDTNISVDIFTQDLRGSPKKWLEVVIQLICIIYAAVFTWQSWISAMRRMARNEVLEIPHGFLTAWPSRFILPVAGASFFLCLVLRFVKTLRAKVER